MDRTTADAQDLFTRGHKRFEEGDFREAVECFSRAITLQPHIAAGYRYRAMAYVELGMRVDALNDLDHAIRLRSDDPLLYADRARLLFRQKSYSAAVADCDKALALDPGLAPIYGLRGECYAAAGESQKAFNDYAAALENDPDHAADYHLARAELYLELEEYEQALADANRAIDLEPEKAAGYQTRGMIRRAMSADHDAERDLSKAIDLEPNRVMARLARATVRMNRNDFSRAAGDCDAVITAAPSISKAFEIRGTCRKQLQDWNGALSDYNEAIRLNPTNPYGFNLRAGLHYHQHNYTRAVQDHLEALKRNPKDAGTFNQLGWIWATAPDPDVRNGVRAKECATRACELTEWQDPGFLDTLAAACAELGEYDDAVKWMEKAIRLVSVDVEDDYQSRLTLYQDGKPVRVVP